MKNLLYLLLASTLLLLSCQPKTNTNKFVGTWKDLQIPSGYAQLKINSKENTFSYQSGGNGTKTFSKGHYEITGDSIALTSLNASDIDGCYIILPFGQCYFKNLRQTKLNCQPSKTEFYDFFDNDIFYLKNNSLIHRDDSNEKCPDTTVHKFVKSK